MNTKLKFDYKKYKLENGLEVILHQDNSLPLVAVNIWYHVGSANETPDKTGFAHLFEHMMFQGSQNVGKEMHFKYIQEAGGSLNGSTSFDRTNYYETVPSNQLELALWLESDRMGFMLDSLTQEKLDNQKDVVMNERRQNYDNQPYGLAWEKMFENLFPKGHPYSWPTIGYMKDIENFELEDVKKFFKTYYSPANASLVIAGDFDFDNVVTLVDKYFGSIKGNAKIPHIIKPPIDYDNTKSITYEDNVQLERIYLGFNSEKMYGTNDASLEIIADLLSGTKNSRLYKSLLFEKQIVQDVTCFQYSGRLDGLFFIVATARPGVELDNIKNEIFTELNNFTQNGFPESDLTRSKNGIASNFIYSLQNLNTLSNYMNNFNALLGEPDSFQFEIDRYQQVNKNQIIDCAKEQFNKPYFELKFIPGDK